MGTGESPPARRESGGRRRRRMGGDNDDDDEEYVVEEEEEEDYVDELSASSAGEEGEDSDAEYQVEDEEEEEEVETPRPKRPVKGGDRGRKGKTDLAAARSRRRKYEEDDDYEEEAYEDEEVEEYHDGLDEVEEEEEEAPQRPKTLVKFRERGQNVELSPVPERSRQRRHDDDMDFDPELDDMDFDPELDDEEVGEEEEEALRQPKNLAKCRGHARNVELSPMAEQSHQRRHQDDTDFDPEFDDEEVEEEEEEVPRPKSLAKCRGRGQNVEPSPVAERSHQRRHEDDVDFDPELDEEDDDEDIDFDPEVDEEEDEFEDEEEEELGAVRARKVSVKNAVKQKSVSKKKSKKKNKKKKSGSKVSRKKVGSAKARKPAPVRRRRKRTLIDDYEDDDDFIVEDQVTLNWNPRKKARTGAGRETEVDLPVSIVEEETWPTVESDSSDFEFVTSDEEAEDVVTPAFEPTTVRKGRKKRISASKSSSDSEFVVSDKELEDLRETEPPPKALPMMPMRKISATRKEEDKGKKKEQPEEAGKPICGICLSEEQRATVQGVLNCCSHYFCFACIMEWSRVESRCPLCKQRFTTITTSSKIDLGLGQRKAVIRVEERDQVYQPTEEEIRRWLDPYENVVCIECNRGGDDSLMLLCDICDSSAHTYCVGLGREVPEGNWYCGGCRLSDEGPSYTRIQNTVDSERPNYRGPVNGSSVGFSMAAPSGTFERSPSINSRRTFQGIDLNLSPREVPGEIHPAEPQASTDSVSTPSGMRATVSGRRQIHRYIRILLAGPRQNNRPEVLLSGLHNSGAVPRSEPNRHNFRSSSEANTSQILSDGIQNQHNGVPFIQAHSNLSPCMSLDGNDFQQIEGVRHL